MRDIHRERVCACGGDVDSIFQPLASKGFKDDVSVCVNIRVARWAVAGAAHRDVVVSDLLTAVVESRRGDSPRQGRGSSVERRQRSRGVDDSKRLEAVETRAVVDHEPHHPLSRADADAGLDCALPTSPRARTGNPEDEYYPDTSVLINLEGIRDPNELLERETEIQISAYEEVFTSFDADLTPDLPFFYYLHHKLFSPLFVWAGRPRTVGISKGGTPFCQPENIDTIMNALFSELERERWLAGLDPDSFLERAAYYVCEINAVHPFREGNARAIRFYIDVLSALTRGDLFDWMQTNAEDYLQACVAGFRGDYSRMKAVLQRCAV